MGDLRFWKRIRVLSPLIGIIFPIEASNIKIYADRNRITHIEMLHTQLEVQMLNVVSSVSYTHLTLPTICSV